jgi:hypothetical protein
MSLNINAVIQSGIVKWPGLKYGTDGKPEFRFTLTRPYQKASGDTGESGYPCCAIGAMAEKLAADLDEGMFVVVTVGELCYRKRQTKAGEMSRLEILVWRVQVGDASVSPAKCSASKRWIHASTVGRETCKNR